MPAPAPINSLPGQSAIAQLLAAGSGQDLKSIDAAGLGQFAAHFQHLIGKQLAVQIDPGALPTAPLATEQAGIEASPDDQLAELLPFIEALGLTQDSVEAAADSETAAGALLAEGTTAEDAATLLAVPVTPPATSIANTPAPAITAANGPHASRQGLAHGQGAPLLAQAATNPAATDNTGEVTTGTPAAAVTPAKELSAGREFASQLITAIAASKEERMPGSTAEAVHQVIANYSPTAAKANSSEAAIASPVGATGWSEEIGNRITWMAGRAESRAELVLTPPQMGRIEVNLSIKGDQAAASFVSANPVVREALEAALPRLREVLADAGIQLGQAQVSAENAHQWAQQEKHGDNSGSDRDRGSTVNAAISPISSGNLSTAATLKAGRGLVDVFA